MADVEKSSELEAIEQLKSVVYMHCMRVNAGVT